MWPIWFHQLTDLPFHIAVVAKYMPVFIDLTEPEDTSIPDTNTDPATSMGPPRAIVPADQRKPRAKKTKISSAGSSGSQEEKAQPKDDDDTSFSR